MANVEAVPGICSRYFEDNFDESEELLCQNCFRILEHAEVLTSELRSAQLTNKMLLEELKQTDSEYKINENISTYEKLKSQSKTYPLSESETPDRNFKNPKKPRGKKTVRVNHQIQTINQQLSKSNLQAPKDNENRPIPMVVNGVTWENNHHYIGNNTGKI
jgi:hypothetical protein